MPTDFPITGDEELASSGAPWLFGDVGEAPEAVAVFIEVPPATDEPASTGIEGLIILISVLTEGFGFVYKAEFGFSSRRESGSTIWAGMYAMARVVIYPRVDIVLYGWRYCMTISPWSMFRP
jgi:hypothetical protein